MVARGYYTRSAYCRIERAPVILPCLMITTPPVQFRGWVACRRDGEGPLGLILIGATTDQPGEVVHLAFSAAAPADFPDALAEVRIERLDLQRYRIASGSKEWIVEGVAHLHREVGKAFYAVVPPRAVPWHKKFLWRLALRIAAQPLLQRMLMRSR